MHMVGYPWRELDEAGRREAMRTAGAVLRDGGLVIVPTETVYGVMAHAGNTSAVQQLCAQAGAEVADGPRFTWHAPDKDALRRGVVLATAVHRRLVDRLLPGPVRFVFEQDKASLSAHRDVLGIERGVIDDGEAVAVRVSSHEIARGVIEWAGVPVVAERLGVTRWGGVDRPDHAVGEIAGFPGVVLDVGELQGAGPSTTIRLRLSGAFEVGEGGRLEEKDVMETLKKRILFVCTGNTCRSPMAEAIARGLDRSRGEDGVEVVFESAGVATGDGMPASGEAVRVIEAMGGDLRPHRSRQLTAWMIEQAERVYVMTESHRDRVLDLVPGSADKVELLDPAGDVPDPIGGPVEVYRETADRLREAIAKRFEERGI